MYRAPKAGAGQGATPWPKWKPMHDDIEACLFKVEHLQPPNKGQEKEHFYFPHSLPSFLIDDRPLRLEARYTYVLSS